MSLLRKKKILMNYLWFFYEKTNRLIDNISKKPKSLQKKSIKQSKPLWLICISQFFLKIGLPR